MGQAGAPPAWESEREVSERVRRLTGADSVAVVGASARAGSVGGTALAALLAGDFAGEVVPINPRHAELAGRRCIPALDALDVPVDLAVLAVPDAVLEDQLELAGRVGVRAAVIFGGSGAVQPVPGAPPLAARLAAISARYDIAVCGPNGMGFIDFARGLRACGFTQPAYRRAGPVTLISHSGSVFSALLHNDRGLEFDLVVSTGQEAVLTVADYLEHALERERTRVVALFLETLRRGPQLRDALLAAAQADVPVVALTVGRSARGGELVRAHSGALAADDGAYEALFDACGVSWVETLDELLDTTELLASGRRAGSGGLATVHDSGGERAHLVDVAAHENVPLAAIADDTRERLRRWLDPGLEATNPLDAWGTGRDFERAYRELLLAMHDDPDTAAVALAVDLTTEDVPDGGYVRVAREVQAATSLPFLVLGNVASAVDPRDAAAIRAVGVPVLTGTRSGLRAVRHLLARRDFGSRGEDVPPAAPAPDVLERWRTRLRTGAALTESEGLRLLADAGLAVAAHTVVGSLGAAVAAAEHLGFPVVCKTAVPGIDHKSDVGGVHLDLRDAAAVAAAYGDLADRLGPEVVVAATAPAGVELAFGAVSDPQLGPLVVVAAGGTLVELLHDRRTALPPFGPRHAARMVSGLRVGASLVGVRGRPPADADAVAEALARFSVLVAELEDELDQVDVNPVVAGPMGCVAVDALVLPRAGAHLTAGAARHPA